MTFDRADFFFVPLLDGRHGVGQILEINATPDAAAFCGLTLLTAKPGAAIAPLSVREIIAFVLVPAGQFTSRAWPIGGFEQMPRFGDVYNYTANKALGFPDTPLHDPAVLEAFLSACHGLYPWSSFGDLFNKIHRSDLERPKAANG
jgi:hypothetical protein